MGLADDIKKAVEGRISAQKLKEACKNALGKMSEDIVNDAKSNLRANGTIDNGTLLNSIYADPVGDDLKTQIIAGASHAAYIEFGTRGYAEKYVATLPKEWKDIAAQFKGQGKGDFVDFVFAILDWMDRKGIKAGTYSVKTRRRLGNKETKQKEDEQLATAIVYAILKKGIKARPYLYPAYVKNRNIFDQELSKVFK